MSMKHIAEIEVSPRKGETVLTRWHVWQERPFPDIGSFREGWRNAGDLFPRYGRPAGDLVERYCAELLRPDFTPDMPNNRLAYSGYYGNQCAFKWLGEGVGEITAKVHPMAPAHPVHFRAAYGEKITPTLFAFLVKNVEPALLAFIGANREGLRREAVEGVRISFACQVQEARERLEKLEAEAREALERLEA